MKQVKPVNEEEVVLALRRQDERVLKTVYKQHYPQIANMVINNGGSVQEAKDIYQETIQKYLCTSQFPDPELMIRTSGEYRISNFLLYQLAYSELYFTKTLWPDFRKENLYEAILDYQNRERRFGKTSEQVKI